MSANTPYGRLTAGVQAGNYGITQAVDPTSTLRDLRQFAGSRRQRAGAIQAGGGVAGPLAGLSEATDAVVAAAKGPRKLRQEQQEKKQQSNAEVGRQRMQQSTLDAYTNAAEDQAAQPSARHVYDLPQRGVTAASTRDSRGAADQWGNTQPDAADDAIGPLGSFGEPAFGRAPGAWAGGAFGGF